jgi:multidrug resistance efflux pump
LIESHYVTTDNAYVEATAAQVTPLMTAQIAARDAEIASAGTDLERAQADFDRRRALAASGAVSAEDLTPVVRKNSVSARRCPEILMV